MQEKILNLGWSVLPYPPYSSDLTESDFYFFHSQQNALADKKFSSEDQVKMFAENMLSSKASEFYLSGINKQPDKWQKLIQNNGEYTIHWILFFVELFMNKSY